jgi:hypothetical protein
MERSRKKNGKGENNNNNSTAHTKKSKKLFSKIEDLIQKAENADTIMRTAKKTLADKRKTSITKEELALLEQAYKNAKSNAERATSVASTAAMAKRKANEKAERMAALKKIDENDKRYLEEETKETPSMRKGVFVNTSFTDKAYTDFLAKQAIKNAAAINRATRRSANRIKQQRITNITGKTKLKRKNVEALLPNVNAETLNLNSEEIAQIITLAHGANVDVGTVLEMLGQKFPTIDEEQGITILKLANTFDLDLEDLRKSIDKMMKKGVPFERVLTILEEIPKDIPISDSIDIVELAHKSGVPVNIVIDFHQAERIRNAFSMKKRIQLLKLAYLAGINNIENILKIGRNDPRLMNRWTNELDVSNALKNLDRMEKEGLTLENILEERRLAAIVKPKTPPKIDRTELIHTITHPTKKKGRSYASVASSRARRINNVKDTYEAIIVRRLPITEIPIHPATKSDDLDPILRKIKGALASNRIFPGKTSPRPNDVRIRVPLKDKPDRPYEVPKGYAIVRFIFKKENGDLDRAKNHEYAKHVISHMNLATTKPTYGKDHTIKKEDVEPSYGDEFFMD